ncbi:holo-ACP synthase [Microbacterium sp. RD1]|uniref:holo-ACP synthase n=1 Tax=Microbacterium sp. RD1 TaxID=3457313 RepID=UPI003FA5FC41
MSIQGVGIDIADVRRFSRLLERSGDGFATRWFSPAEVEMCRARRRPAVGFAEHFAVKEAVWKALGPDRWTQPLAWRQIEVTGDTRLPGPAVSLHGFAADLAGADAMLHVTVATRGDLVVATVVLSVADD